MKWEANLLTRDAKPAPEYVPGALVFGGRMRIKAVRWVYDYWVYIAVPA